MINIAKARSIHGADIESLKHFQKEPQMLNNTYKVGNWIEIGKSRKDAVICNIYEKNKMEVVYLDDLDRAINEDIILKEDIWEFENANPCGGYADKYDRLKEYVTILRKGSY